jgi:hypothetical protein
MSSTPSNFVRVADLSDVTEGTPKAVNVEGRSIALFQHQAASMRPTTSAHIWAIR